MTTAPAPPGPLATPGDLEARLGRPLSADEAARAVALLADASALVRSYTRRTFTFVADDAALLRPVGNLLRIPQTPVLAVYSLTARLGTVPPVVNEGDPPPRMPCVLVPPGLWTFDGIDTINVHRHHSWWLNAPEAWDWHHGVDTYTVCYSHGYTTVPADVLAVVCSIALRVLLSPSMSSGMVSERIGAYSYQLGQTPGISGATAMLTAGDKELLARYRVKATTVQLRM